MGRSMREYKGYFIGPDGRIAGRVDLVCADDDDARERAKDLADSQPVELWQLDRMIGKIGARRSGAGREAPERRSRLRFDPRPRNAASQARDV